MIWNQSSMERPISHSVFGVILYLVFFMQYSLHILSRRDSYKHNILVYLYSMQLFVMDISDMTSSLANTLRLLLISGQTQSLLMHIVYSLQLQLHVDVS